MRRRVPGTGGCTWSCRMYLPGDVPARGCSMVPGGVPPGGFGGTCQGGVPGPEGGVPARGVPGPRGCTWSWGCNWSQGVYMVTGIPGPRGTWYWGVYLVPWGYLVLGVVHGPGGTCPGTPPVNRMTDRCKKYYLAPNFVCGW